MKLSPEMEAQFAENRMKKMNNQRNRTRCFWGFVILGVVLFGSAFLAGSLSTLHDGMSGPYIFYAAMAAAAFQILLAIGTVVAGVLNYREVRLPGLIYMLICIALLIYTFLNMGQNFAVPNIVFLLAGIGLSIWAQSIFNTEELLKLETGYPLFSPEASFSAEYELPADVVAAKAKASDRMETIGGVPEPVQNPAPVPQPAAPAIPAGKEIRMPAEIRLPEIKASDFGLEAQLGSGQNAVPVPEITGDVTLNSLAAAVDSASETGEAALPKLSAEDLLMDMTAAPSHATVKGDASLLPDPAEVRARMAAMKRAREEHPRV